MAALAPLAWIGGALGINYVAPDIFAGKGQNNNNSNSNNQNQPVYHIQPAQNSMGLGSALTAVCVGGGVVVFFGAYRYFFGNNPLDKILPEMEKNSREALEQIKMADENAQKRNEQMDENTRKRLLELQGHLTAENRGNFEVLSEQIHCLTQITLQNFTALMGPETEHARAITAGGDEQAVAEYKKQRQGALQYAAEAQRVAEEISSPNYQEEKRNQALQRIRAQIPEMNSITNGASSLSAPHDLSASKKRQKKQEKSMLGSMAKMFF